MNAARVRQIARNVERFVQLGDKAGALTALAELVAEANAPEPGPASVKKVTPKEED